ncbi:MULTISPECIES: 4'-phosphopantetheinyl transferase family protein [Deefgea]|uniref:4'-phosphopantetheinyl transferase superfamily protein n=1 Tax=Deefgea chitinilytica TaxID=570276 RepID=A0ABS2CBR9_9NEIS|nr:MULTISPECIES: 4'-phosphopantetheinyl transferase superfamily protein [Deefgea]MBM5571477.1 4'-phosphopantetheinyl transferase superfamily protein [Deefgea chitinilytica]MBM9888710.1 4'-phosphopantetheinyl transferase superfamily protein [Deefgea sp. CFH1-16]
MLISYFAVSAMAATTDFSATLAGLDAAQLKRLAAIQNSLRRTQFLSARHLAQQLLQLSQTSSVLSQHENGRPWAPAWSHTMGLSWSHGAQFCAAALGQGRVGIDIETMRPRKQCLSIAERYFDPRETAWLASLAADQQQQAFFMLWVAKEALLKALGTGIVGGLARFVLLNTSTGWCCETSDALDWFVSVWQIRPNVILALASDTPQQWQYPAVMQVDHQDWQLILKI